MTVYVYRNLAHGRRARPLYSIMHKGRVIARRHRVLIAGAMFVVREAGRRRVIKTGRKNVHAFVKGTLVDSRGIFGMDENSTRDLPIEVRYDPELYFHHHGAQLQSARGVLLNERGMSACYCEYTR